MPMPTRGARWAPWALLVLVLAIPIGWGIDASFPWDVDNLAPGSVLKGLAARFAPGWTSSYGPLPYYLMAAAYVPLLLVAKIMGQLGAPSGVYPWGLAHPDFWMGALSIAARMVSLLMAIGFAVLAWARERRLGHPVPSSVIVLLLAGAPVFVYYARTSNVDIHFLFWIALAFTLVERPGARLGTLAAGAAAAMAAVCSKEQIVPFALVAVLVALARALREGAPGRFRALAAAAIVITPLVVFAILWRLPWNLAGLENHVRFLIEDARYPRTYPADFAGTLGLAGAALRHAPVAFGWPMLTGLMLAALFRIRVSDLGARLLASALYLVGFIGAIGYVYPRFLLTLFLVTVPIAARGWTAAIERASAASTARRAAFATLAALALLGGPLLDVVMLRDARYRVEAWMARNLRPDSVVEVVGNPHFQARVPHATTLVRTSLDELTTSPRGPRGDIVLVSGKDGTLDRIARDPRLGTIYYAPLVAAGPGARYEAIRFEASPLSRWVPNLPVDPPVTVYASRIRARPTGR
jgi:hypothetical protein